MYYFSIYLAGILSFFSPCILPVIPVYFSILSGSESSPDLKFKRLFAKALLFCLGFTLVFSLLGGGAGTIAPFIKTNKVSINILAGIIITILGLKFLNVLQISFLDRSYSINHEKLRTRFGLLNAFMIGLLFAITWSPCIGAVLGGILSYVSATGNGLLDGAIKLSIYGIGVSTPLLLSVFLYRRLADFYRTNIYFFDMVKKLLGFILLIFAFSLFHQVALVSKNAQKSISPLDKVMIPDTRPLLMSFTSSSCEDCESMKPVIEKLRTACGGKLIDFREVNVNDQQYEYLVYQQGIFGTPTYILIDDKGKEKQRLMGIQKLDTINNEIKVLTGKSCTN